MDFTTLTINILNFLGHLTGSYGFGIILLTFMIRLAMWPLSVSQQRSMKKMQELSPRLKEIQNRYKNDPQTMQKKMMEFYKEHNFNPFGGCFPLLLQMPVFIMLYAALVSPQFIEVAGKTSFLFINRLDSSIRSHAGVSGDNVFGIAKHDTFSSGSKATVYLKNGAVKDVKIKDSRGIFMTPEMRQEQIIPGKPYELKANADKLELPDETLNNVQKVKMAVINNNTKEIEHITFDNTGSTLDTKVKTEEKKEVFHPDVLVLIALFGITMFWSQKVMTSMSSNVSLDPAQKAMQDQMSKIMPIMITSTFVFFPIPAGVLLYMIASNTIQVIQTILINKQLELEGGGSSKVLTGNLPADAKKVESKEVKKDEVPVNGLKQDKKDNKHKW